MARPQRGGSAPLDDLELRAWHGMLRAYGTALAELDRRLLSRHRISVRTFDVLITLANAPDRRIAMSRLADHVVLSPSGLTRLVQRLESDGLVVREPHPADARSSFAVLTAQGVRRLEDARTTHDETIREVFTGRLRRDDLRALVRGWRAALGHDPYPSPPPG